MPGNGVMPSLAAMTVIHPSKVFHHREENRHHRATALNFSVFSSLRISVGWDGTQQMDLMNGMWGPGNYERGPISLRALRPRLR